MAPSTSDPPPDHDAGPGHRRDARPPPAVPRTQHVAPADQADANAFTRCDEPDRPKEGFAWSDPTRSDTQQDALEAEGVTFVGGQADPAARLSPDDIEGLVLTASG